MKSKKFYMKYSLRKRYIQHGAIYLFRSVVRDVIHNLYWLNDTEVDVLTNDFQKNLILLGRKKHDRSIITFQEKLILRKPPEYRTETEKNKIWKVIDALRCFQRYPEAVKHQLAECSGFQYYPAERIILRQNDTLCLAMYVILTGIVSVTRMEYDPIMDEMVEKNLGKLSVGYTFGEVSLFHNTPRTATVKTLTDCEFLVVSADNFNRVLKESVQAKWDEIELSMKRFSIFDSWDKKTIRECCLLSKIRSYKPSKLILGEGTGSKYYSYFITEGTCQLIEELVIIGRELLNMDRQESLKNIPGGIRSAAISLQDLEPERELRLDELVKKKKWTNRRENKCIHKCHFLQLCLMKPGFFFNVGENLKNRCIVALTNVTLICIPQYILKMKDYDHQWHHHAKKFDSRMPTRVKLHEEMKLDAAWELYKKTLVNNVVEKKRKHVNTMHNVPYYCRINSPVYSF